MSDTVTSIEIVPGTMICWQGLYENKCAGESCPLLDQCIMKVEAASSNLRDRLLEGETNYE
jgi:hypothetical protein